MDIYKKLVLAERLDRAGFHEESDSLLKEAGIFGWMRDWYEHLGKGKNYSSSLQEGDDQEADFSDKRNEVERYIYEVVKKWGVTRNSIRMVLDYVQNYFAGIEDSFGPIVARRFFNYLRRNTTVEKNYLVGNGSEEDSKLPEEWQLEIQRRWGDVSHILDWVLREHPYISRQRVPEVSHTSLSRASAPGVEGTSLSRATEPERERLQDISEEEMVNA